MLNGLRVRFPQSLPRLSAPWPRCNIAQDCPSSRSTVKLHTSKIIRSEIGVYRTCSKNLPSFAYRQARASSHAQAAKDLNQKSFDEHLSEFEDLKEKQARTPWHREGVDTPPVRRQRSAGAMTKGTFLLPDISGAC